MNTTPDAALVAAFAAGDRSAGDALFRRHLGTVRRFLAARCRDGDLAEELAQEVAARVTVARDRLDPAGNAEGFMIRAAHNVWRDWLRRELVRRRSATLLDAERRPAPALADAEVLADELRGALARAVAALPRAQRDVVRLRHGENLTFQQIADRLHRPLGTVLGQMRAALHRMHEMMEAYR